MSMKRKDKILIFICIICLAIYLIPDDDDGFIEYFFFESPPSENLQEIQLQTPESEAAQLFVYNYVVNVTEIIGERYLKRLRETINLHNFPSNLHLSKKRSYPCLIPKEIQIKYPATKYVTGTNFTMPFIFVNPTHHLGNAMGEYATQFALSKLYGISTAMSPEMRKVLIEIFPTLSMEQLPLDMDTDSLKCMNLPSDGSHDYNFAPSEIASAGLFGLDCFEIQKNPFDIRIFNGVRNQIVREFTFSDTIQQKVREFFSSVQESVSQMKEFQDSTVTYISVHARRQDYLNQKEVFGATIPDDIYFIRAMQYYRKKFTMPIFIASSDDMDYIRNVLQNETGVFYSTGGTPETDMAILSSCNHSIFGVGSYGFWTAYLNKGDTVYADVPIETPYTFTKYYYEDARLPNFIPLPYH